MSYFLSLSLKTWDQITESTFEELALWFRNDFMIFNLVTEMEFQ